MGAGFVGPKIHGEIIIICKELSLCYALKVLLFKSQVTLVTPV
jgi:hypothetical protein